MTCDCAADGFCARYRREMTGRLREICRGENIAPDKAIVYRQNWATLTAQNAPQTCAYLGEPTGRTIKCGQCKDGTKLKVFQCGVHGECTIARPVGVACCVGCQQKVARGVIGGKLVKRFDEHNLAPGRSGKRFNPSLAVHGDGYLLAYRDGWAGSEIHLIRLDAGFNPTGEPWRLQLRHSKASYGREDPRLFWHNGRLHVAYVGVVGHGRQVRTNVLYARLTEDCFGVEHVFYPHYEQRNDWEKNWSPFSSGGELFAIYSVAPHRILRVDGEHATMAYQTPTHFPWSGGELRGGAAPVLIGEEWWHFVHDRITVGGVRTYRTGLYTFANKPPFRVLRYIPEPILFADGSSRPGDQYASVVFTCGAVRDGDSWVLSSGVHDRWTELHRFSHAELEDRLRPGPTPAERIPSVIAPLNGWCTTEKAKALADAVLSLKPKLAVEIGVFAGKSLIPIAMALQSLGDGKVIGIDPWSVDESTKELSGANREWWQRVDHSAMQRECREVVDREYLWPFVELVQARSDAYALPDGSVIDLLHIDGSHGEEASCYDVTHYAARVRPCGMLFMDDIGWAGKAYSMLPGMGFKELRQLDTGAIFVRAA